jgi:Icc-related predicted phosphoesterase
MKIIAITDIHGHLDAIDRIGPELKTVDLVLVTGDITHFGREKEAQQVIQKITEYNRQILTVPGNCDQTQVETYLNLHHINLHGRGKKIDSLGIMGLGGSLPCPGHTPNEYSEQQLTEFLQRGRTMLGIDCNPFILVSHQPPKNTVNDRVTLNIHVGSKSVREFIEQSQPLICFTGHIHEGIGIDTIGPTKIINPGPLRKGGYTYAEIGTSITSLEIKTLSCQLH